jgi:hypothetical protein
MKPADRPDWPALKRELTLWWLGIEAWWWGLPPVIRAPAWLGLWALLFALVLLLAFTLVVRQSVQQGESLRGAVATHADAVARCNGLRGARAKESCLARLAAPPDEDTAAVDDNTVQR